MNLRHSARALLVDPEQRLLLLRGELPDRTFWFAPGGGLEPGESGPEALGRELFEELGLRSVAIGDHVWHQPAVGPYAAGYDGVLNDYYVVPIEHFTPESTPEWAAETIVECRWWTSDELFEARVAFSPSDLPNLFRRLLTDGMPARPLALGV